MSGPESALVGATIHLSPTEKPIQNGGESKRAGRVAAGFDADLVVLKRDPSKDIRALSAVQYTLRAGKILHRP